jgi:uncharacterized membrane protein YqhA
MRRLLSSTRFLVVIAVFGLICGAVITFGWGLHGVYQYGETLLDGDETQGLVGALKMIDTFLLATVMMVFGVGLWELFVGDLDLPEWLEIHSLDDLKSKLADVIVLVVAIKALEKLTTAKTPLDALYYSAAAGLIVLGLTLSSLVKITKRATK